MHSKTPWRIQLANGKQPSQILAADGSVVAKLTALDMENAEIIVSSVNYCAALKEKEHDPIST